MKLKLNEIVNHENIEVGKVMELECICSNGILTILRALIKSITLYEIEIEPLAQLDFNKEVWKSMQDYKYKAAPVKFYGTKSLIDKIIGGKL